MCDWIGQVIDNYLGLIYRSIRKGLFEGDYIQIDETPIPYVEKGGMGKSRKGYFWVFGHPNGNVCFDWQLGRSNCAAQSALKGYTGGLMQSDGLPVRGTQTGYAVYDKLSKQFGSVQLGCWAHARRKFYNALELGQMEAALYLAQIRKLYKIERSLPEDPEKIQAIRNKQSRPIIDKIHKLLQKDLHQPAKVREPLQEAINYAHSQWPKLTAYLKYPQTRIDNNRAEQSIRPCKLGVKNWLFIGHPTTGHRSAVIYTLIESCKRHGIEPQAYLTDLLERLPAMTNHEAEKLTPDKVGSPGPKKGGLDLTRLKVVCCQAPPWPFSLQRRATPDAYSIATKVQEYKVNMDGQERQDIGDGVSGIFLSHFPPLCSPPPFLCHAVDLRRRRMCPLWLIHPNSYFPTIQAMQT